jgi:hypothetical protein
MKPVMRFFPFSFIAALLLSCTDNQLGLSPRDAACFDKPGLITTRPTTTSLLLTCVIAVPGNPILSGTKSWVDSATQRFYETDVSNAGLDVIDARADTFVGRVSGFVGATGVAATSGPNSIVFVPNGRAWVSDGNSNVQVVDVNSLQIIASVSTAIPACDGGTATTHYCQRTNEITYDPEDQLIFVENPSPQAVTAPHGPIDPYATFISAVPPYTIVGTITFPGAGGQEAPLWDPQQHRLLSAVSGTLNAGGTAVVNQQYIAVINPRTMTVEKKYMLDCQALRGIVALGINDPALGPNENAVIPGCGKAILFNAATGAMSVVNQVGGGNETWYNPGDNRFYVIGADSSAGGTGVISLGVIDAATGAWLQNVPAVGATNPTAFAANNNVFAVVQVTAAQVAAPATDNTACTRFGATGGGLPGRGCIVVFSHALQ